MITIKTIIFRENVVIYSDLKLFKKNNDCFLNGPPDIYHNFNFEIFDNI